MASDKSFCCSSSTSSFAAHLARCSWVASAFHLLLHVVNLQRKYRQSVHSPCGTLCVEVRVRQRSDLAVLRSEVGVYLFYQIRTVLIAAVYAPFQRKSLCRVYMRVAYNVLKVPLYGVNPAFHVQAVVYVSPIIRILNGSVHIVGHVVISYRLAENVVALFCE